MKAGILKLLSVALALAINIALFASLALLNQAPELSAVPQLEAQVYVRPEPTLLEYKEIDLKQDQAPESEPVDELVEDLAIDDSVPEPAVEPLELSVAVNVPSMNPVRVVQPRALPRTAKPRAENKPKSGTGGGNRRSQTSNVVRNATQVDEPPRAKPGNPKPSYPRAAARRRLRGQVVVKMRIDEEGQLVSFEVLRTVGHKSFERSVRKALKSWSFFPARHQGRPVPVIARKTFQFRWGT